MESIDNVLVDIANTFYDHGTHAEIFFNDLGAGNLDNNGTNDPGLGPLQFNGGFTRTHRPQTGSPAIDAGLNSLAIVPFTTPSTALDYDQRGNGFDRFYDVPGIPAVDPDPLQTVDIGAYEISLPKVIEVVISASNSGEEQSYFDLVNRLNESNGDQIRALPFNGADTITILFSEPVIKFGNELGLESIRTGENYDDYGELAYLANESTPTKGVWKLHDPTPNDDFYAAFKPLDQVLISLKDTIYAKEWGTAANAALDGEWINPASLNTEDPDSLISEFPSGNGTTGGEFRFVFTTDPLGDYDGSGSIGQGDLDAVLLNWGALEADIPTAYPMWVGLMLLDGNDFIGQDDLNVVLLNWGADLSLLETTLLFGDYNNDGFVGQADLDIVLLGWGDDESSIGNIPPDAIWADLDSNSIISQAELDAVILGWGLDFDTNENV